MGDGDLESPARRSILDEGRPSRGASIFVGLAMIVAVALLLLRRPQRDEAPRAAVPVAPVSSLPSNAADQLASAMAELEKLPLHEGPPLAKIQEALEGVAPSDKGYLLPDGRIPPQLPPDAPRVVRFGVVLVRYRGAQLAPMDAPARDVAFARALQLASVAKSDFAAAVRGGDQGSAVDIGTVQRGILEPATQYVLFTLPPGAVSDVLDTPRGFWILRRIR